MSQTTVNPLPRRYPPSENRQRLPDPEMWLLNSVLESALERINTVLEFARNWEQWKHTHDYERQRATCRFHLQWIFDDEPSEYFTFRELCRFSRSAWLKDVEPARARIREAFSPAAVQELERTVSPFMQKRVKKAWLDPDWQLIDPQSHSTGQATLASRTTDAHPSYTFSLRNLV